MWQEGIRRTHQKTTYSSVVARDSVRIMFTVAASNGLEVLSADVQNAYRQDKRENLRHYRQGVRTNEGRPAFIVRALYGPKSSGARWRDHMASSPRANEFLLDAKHILMYGYGQPQGRMGRNIMNMSGSMLTTYW